MTNTDVMDYRNDIAEHGNMVDHAAAGATWRSTPKLVIACFVYALSAMILFPQSYLTVFVMNANRFVPFAVFSAVLVIYVQRMLSGSRVPIVDWYMSYLRRFGMQGLICSVVFVFGLSAFSTYKTNIPSLVPFYADVYIAPFDAWLHGGQPWRYTHLIPDWMGGVIDFVYSRLWFLLLIGTFTVVSFVYQGAKLKRYLWSVFLLYSVLGSVLAISLSSVGPIFYGSFYPDQAFSGLLDSLNANDSIVQVKRYAMYLLAAERASETNVGTGISAMPSLHVAFAVLFAWLLTGWGRVSAVIGWLYAAFIMFGSVYTGWHYAVDGYLSAVLTSAIWIGVSRYYRLPIIFSSRRAGIASGSES